ncbi:MAG: hypothetical protein ACK6CT_16025 [Planctomycetia bacterium]|jgi:hypothetical protein
MHGPLARRLRREAHAHRPDSAWALQQRTRAAVAAEPSRVATGARGRVRPNGWIAIQSCVVVALAVVTIALSREPVPSPPDQAAARSAVPLATAAPATEPTLSFEEMVADLVADTGTEVRTMAAALIGMPDWNDLSDVDSTLALLAPPPQAERP